MKRIATPADLAIHGAPPAFSSPLHVGRPNLGDRSAFGRMAEDMFDRGWLTNNGPLVQELERRIAAHLGVKHCVAICNGTVALEIAIRALHLTGEVIVPSYTFVATAHAVAWLGLTPVFADIDPATHNLDPESVRARITPRTSAILGVHLWGRPAPVEALSAIAGEHRLTLFFDAAHAFACSHGGRMIGSFGACEVLSFHATKFFNTGEGGAIVTDDDELAERLRLMRNFGFASLDHVVSLGVNGKMQEISAALGLMNLDHLGPVVEANRRIQAIYREELAGVPGLDLIRYDERERNNWQYAVVEVGPECPARRDRLVDALRAENVLARRYFWPGVHNMEPYRTGQPSAGEDLPATRLVSERVMVLPNGLSVDEESARTVAAILRTAALDRP